jgi:hypothetical protein
MKAISAILAIFKIYSLVNTRTLSYPSPFNQPIPVWRRVHPKTTHSSIPD